MVVTRMFCNFSLETAAFSSSASTSPVFTLPRTRDLQLEEINAELWGVEDALRLKEKERDFGATFVKLARSVYKLNDQRFFVKNIINKETSSSFQEQKNITP